MPDQKGKSSIVAKPIESEKIVFIERIRSEHIPLTLKSLSDLEHVAKGALLQNQKIKESQEKFREARKLTNTAQEALLPSDFLMKYRAAQKTFTEGATALAEGIDKNAEDIKFYGNLIVVGVLTAAVLIETRGLWVPLAGSAITGTVTMTATQADKLGKITEDMGKTLEEFAIKADASPAWARYVNAAKNEFEILKDMTSKKEISKVDTSKFIEAADRVARTGETLAKEVGGETIYSKLFFRQSETLKAQFQAITNP